MKIALVHDHYDEKKLESVKSEMVVLGAPVIRAVWLECYDLFAALEGCHRIRAAKELGLEPVIEEIEYDDIADLKISETEGYDIEACCDETFESLLFNGANYSTIIEF